MNFEEWWGGDRDRTLAYDLMKVLTEAAKQAWHAGHATSIEEMLEKWNRTGVDIDAALHGRVNEKSPIAGRLRMIAAAQPQWRPIETAPDSGFAYLASDKGLPPYTAYQRPDGVIVDATGRPRHPSHWTPLPLPPVITVTGKKEQEARDVT